MANKWLRAPGRAKGWEAFLTNRAFMNLSVLKRDHLNELYNEMVNGSFKTRAFTGDNVVFVPVASVVQVKI